MDSWRTPKEKAGPRASLGGPTYAKVYDGPDQELSAQLERCYSLAVHCHNITLWHV